MSRHRLPRYGMTEEPWDVRDLLDALVPVYARRNAPVYCGTMAEVLDRWHEVTDEDWAMLLLRLAAIDDIDIAAGKAPWQPYPPSERVAEHMAALARFHAYVEESR